MTFWECLALFFVMCGVGVVVAPVLVYFMSVAAVLGFARANSALDAQRERRRGEQA